MKYQVVDFSKVTGGTITAEQLKVISNLEKSASRWDSEIKMAPVYLDPKWLPDSQQNIETLATTGWAITFFQDINQALKWCTASTTK